MSDPDGPAHAWAPPTPGTDPTVPMAPIDPTAQMVVLDPAVAGAPRRSRGRLVGALAGVGALAVAGGFAVVTIAGNDDAGGAATPEEVGTALVTALENEDVLGVIDLLLPGERDTFREPLIDTLDHLVRLDLLSTDASLDRIAGLDIQLTDVTVREERTNVDDIVNIVLSGAATVSVDGDAVPLGGLLVDEAFEGDRPDMDVEPESSEFDDLQLTTVEQGGRWYLSGLYTLAEQARGETDLDIPDEGIAPRGGEDPEGAVDTFLDAVVDLDLRDAIAALDPTEVAALQRYAPLFLDDAQGELDDVEVDLSITEREYRVEGSGSRRSIAVVAMVVEASVPDEDVQVSIRFADDCVTVTADGEDTELCTGDVGGVDDAIDDVFGTDGDAFAELADVVGDAFADLDLGGIAVHEVDGSWYVSPMRTVFDAIDAVLTALDRDELSAIVDAARSTSDDVLDYLDDAAESIEITSSSGTGSSDGSDDRFAALDECYAMEDAASGVACMQEGVASGAIDPDHVSTPYLYPECGVAELYWRDVYAMGDDEFVKMAEEASPCFVELVANGEIDSFAVPGELLAPQCLEGKNWYASFDDDYSNRFFECVADARAAL